MEKLLLNVKGVAQIYRNKPCKRAAQSVIQVDIVSSYTTPVVFVL